MLKVNCSMCFFFHLEQSHAKPAEAVKKADAPRWRSVTRFRLCADYEIQRPAGETSGAEGVKKEGTLVPRSLVDALSQHSSAKNCPPHIKTVLLSRK